MHCVSNTDDGKRRQIVDTTALRKIIMAIGPVLPKRSIQLKLG